MNFHTFLDDIFLGDRETIDTMQRLVGYAATGDRTESLIAACWGTGRNGKSTFFRVLGLALGQAVAVVEQRSILCGDFGAPNPDLLAMQGVRLAVLSNGYEKDCKGFVGKMKAFSSEETLRARAPFGKDFTEFRNEATPFLVINDSKRFQRYPLGFRSRCVLIEFPAVFTSAPGDRAGEKMALRSDSILRELTADIPAIQDWIDQGTRLYRSEGLVIPARFRADRRAIRRAA